VLAELCGAVPTAANIGHYAGIIRDKARQRALIEAAGETYREGMRGIEDTGDWVDRSLARIFSAAEAGAKSEFVRVGDALGESFKAIERFYEQQGITGVPTGYREIDRLTSGLQRGDLIIVAGRPSMGKTAFALNIAGRLAIGSPPFCKGGGGGLDSEKTPSNSPFDKGGEKNAVAIFSLEMSREQLVWRLLCAEGKVNYANMRGGFLGQRDWPSLTAAAGRLHEAGIYIDDTPGATVFDIRAKARRLKAARPELALVVIDYLQLMNGTGDRREQNREQEIATISRALKRLARELGLPVVALSQLSRAPERRADMRPMLSDLRESGAIEQDADLIMFIYRDEVYKKDSPDRGAAEIIIRKQRMGPTGTVRLAFQSEFTRFDDLAEEPEGDL